MYSSIVYPRRQLTILVCCWYCCFLSSVSINYHLIIAGTSIVQSSTDEDETYHISTVAGTGYGQLRVNVLALQATFGSITGFVQSKNGDLYAAVRGNHVLLKFEFDKAAGTWSNVEIIAGKEAPGQGAENVLGTQSAISYPSGLSLIEDNSTGEVTAVLVVDSGNHRIRKLNMSTRMITTIAGTVSRVGGFSGDIYITDTDNNRIRRVSGDTISTVVGKTCTDSDELGDGGKAVGACLKRTYHFTMNEAGEWFIVDYDNGRIRKVHLNGAITTVAGGGTETGDALATSVQIVNPEGMVVTPSESVSFTGQLLVAEYSGRGIVRKMDSSGFMRVIAGGGSETPSPNHPIPAKTANMAPKAVAYARDGSDAIFISDNRGFIFKLTISPKCYGVESNNSAVCSGHGSCIGEDRCKCDNGWMGANCSVMPECFGIVFNDTFFCSGHGSCVATDQCQCDEGWMGVDCSITHCFGVTSNVPDVVCSGKGECISHNKCRCVDGFRGHKCQRPPSK